MNRTQLLIGLVALAVVALGVAAYFVFSGSSSSDSATAAQAGPLAIIVSKDDRTLGSPKAPMTVLEYAAPTCPHCAHFDMDIFPQFKQQYIDTGKVYFVFRVFPLNAVDVAAESMARCLPEDNYFQFLDQLYRNQAKWDPDGYNIPDVHGALVDQGKIAGMDSQKVDSCIGNPAEQKRVQDVGTDAQTRYGVSGTPTFIANGQIHGPFQDFSEMQGFLDPLLAKK
ncbi:MAG TPA: thioredoxin domain-containing protein [Rhizomicrobium sp.]|nr:thioredoxin domain-containing protein [Rhizomicrobium sp.]